MKYRALFTIPNPVTADWLEQFHPCPEELQRFRKEFPFGVHLTLAHITKAALLRFNLDWFAMSCLPVTARDAYEKARAPARDAYDKARAPALYNVLKGLRR